MENKQALFDRLFSQYKDWVYRLCYSYTDNEAIAEDLVQECFSKVWLHLDGFENRSAYSTWIYRIAANTCLMQLRREKRNPVEYHETLADRAADVAERTDNLYYAIAQLTEIDRLIISMVLEEMLYKEIGEVLGITENNVSVKVHRIKKQLKELLLKTC